MGVEEDFLLIDPVSGRTAMRADAALARLHDTPSTCFNAALAASQIEAATGPCTDLAELRSALNEARWQIRGAAHALGLGVLSLGVPYHPGRRPLSGNGERFRTVVRTYAGVVTDCETCGCRVQISMPDRDTAVAVLNHLRPWLPTLLALSANSPVHDGRDTGYASWRTVLRSRFPCVGVAPYFTDGDDYDRHIDRMVNCGVLADDTMTFWLARFSPTQPTVEFRVADAVPDVEDAVLQAALSRALVRTALADVEEGRDAPRVRDEVCAAAVWSAARYGLRGPGVHPVREIQLPAVALLHELTEHVSSALKETGDLEVFEWLETCR